MNLAYFAIEFSIAMRVQVVTDSWALVVDMRAQYLRSQGLLVVKLDNRGSTRRGLSFEGAVKGDMGNLE